MLNQTKPFFFKNLTFPIYKRQIKKPGEYLIHDAVCYL